MKYIFGIPEQGPFCLLVSLSSNLMFAPWITSVRWDLATLYKNLELKSFKFLQGHFELAMEVAILVLLMDLKMTGEFCAFNLIMEGDLTTVLSWVANGQRGSWRSDNWI